MAEIYVLSTSTGNGVEVFGGIFKQFNSLEEMFSALDTEIAGGKHMGWSALKINDPEWKAWVSYENYKKFHSNV